MTNKVEILAPAGSIESLRAAILAGASAVYLGGTKFGARAYADNFNEESLLEAIDYVHLHNRQIYLTVNTLLKNKELEQELYSYLRPLYRQGLDAVIVQDPGVVEYIRKYFPGLSIHASTQMTVTSASGAKFLKKQGIERVVPARELSLGEVKKLKKDAEMEVECFVHGALCYCYSGQCYMSSLIGGRSGNRGQCAQPCRLLYQAERQTDMSYLMSLKDICTIEHIPELIEAGIDSFKIEGRMKRPEYVAGVTMLYKKYTELYYRCGRSGFAVEKEDMEKLMDLYNRGGFHKGYYLQKNGPEMLTTKKPSHAGVAAVHVKSQKGQIVSGMACTRLNKGDVIELPGCKDDYTLGNVIEKGEDVVLSLRKGVTIPAGTTLYRVKNQQLLTELGEFIEKKKLQEKIKGKLMLSSQVSAKLVLTCQNQTVEVEGPVFEIAQKQPTSKEQILLQMQKTGNTPFQFELLELELAEELFVPIQILKDLRRSGLAALTDKLTGQYRRLQPIEEQKSLETPVSKSHPFPNMLYVSVETKEQMETAAAHESVSRIYVDCTIMPEAYQHIEMQTYISRCKIAGKEVYYVMPYIFRAETEQKYCESYDRFVSMGYDGMLVRNYESLHFLREQGYTGNVVLDYNMYQFNHESKKFFARNQLPHGTAPIELNETELAEQGVEDLELLIYGYLPMMVSAQCMQKSIGECKGRSKIMYIRDRYQNKFAVKNFCDCCYNVIYNTSPLLLADLTERLQRLNPKGLRVRFTMEDKQETKEVLDYCASVLLQQRKNEWKKEFTRGHFRRGIK